MTFTINMTELDEICEYALSYEINMINDTNGIIDLFSIESVRDSISKDGIHLYLDVRGTDEPVDGEEYFTIYRMSRIVSRNPHEQNSGENIDISNVNSLKCLNDLIFKHMEVRGERP